MLVKNAPSKIVFGSDPEYFAGHKKDGEWYVVPPAYFRTFLDVDSFPNGRHPVFIDRIGDLGVMIIEDGVAFEQTVRPSTDWKELYERMRIGRELLSNEILSKFPDECSPETLVLPTINYEVNRWSRMGDEFQNCLIFGCDQDFDAWKANAAGKVVDALQHPFRYGGGHMHISGVEFFREEPILSVKALSLTVGLAAVAFSPLPELDKARTYLYGRPGKYRFQQYRDLFDEIPNTNFGIEYRTPSNMWTSSLEHAEQVFNWATFCVRTLIEGGLYKKAIKKFGTEARRSIIECDQNTAKSILKELEVWA